ncbi:HK97 family phage prohead protease [Mesorhizobium sp. YM1C-6-2]|uniref:HK97 family phage prohead protease n=1 Tax=Mesorhizobium sp. YM1C-6-2 TaxID=1827501 RepID=UPI000EF20B61|nr:HK97 family phage prohead protease [Mesorhizobium sp. YM1C-6-2]RLP22175.1 HK97 family phage prohead protease [Mesorhizobium sp. YM1C-6-2]
MAETISGYAIQWRRPAVIGGLFEESFDRGAFDKSLREHPDVVALWSHDSARPLGRVANGTLALRSDNIGLHYILTPNADSPMGQEALATVGRADVGQVSVGFSSMVEEWSDTDDMPRRLITEARLHELSLVVWGAYGDDTSASLSRTAAPDNASSALRRLREKAERQHRLRGI